MYPLWRSERLFWIFFLNILFRISGDDLIPGRSQFRHRPAITEKFLEIDFSSPSSSVITRLPIGPLSPPRRHRYGSPVSIQAKASCGKGRQTSCQAESHWFIHRNINSNGIRLWELGDYAPYRLVCPRQYRGSECDGETQTCDRKVSRFIPYMTYW